MNKDYKSPDLEVLSLDTEDLILNSASPTTDGPGLKPGDTDNFD